jgi:hypothetical protein
MIPDDDGHYEFGALAAGEYRVSAGKSGYTSLTFGQHTLSDPGQPLVFKMGNVRSWDSHTEIRA